MLGMFLLHKIFMKMIPILIPLILMTITGKIISQHTNYIVNVQAIMREYKKKFALVLQ